MIIIIENKINFLNELKFLFYFQFNMSNNKQIKNIKYNK